MVEGLTIRDIVDCYVLGVLSSTGKPMSENPVWNDVYKVDWDSLDPFAVAQNMACCIEKYMGIFPNIPDKDKTNG